MTPSDSHASDRPRSRTFEWEDPRPALEARQHLSGLDYLTRIIDGTLPPPPMARLMNIRLVEAARGRAAFECAVNEYHANLLGSVHGGMAATLLDSAMGCAVFSCLEAGDRYTTLDIKVTYLRAIRQSVGRVRAVATLVHLGRTVALAEGRVVCDEDLVYVHATSTCLIKRATPASL
ncbi:MAG: PaaI family thioesterase [Acidobacteriota bacterium]